MELLAVLMRGGIVMIPLLLCSLVSLAVIVAPIAVNCTTTCLP